MIRLVGWILASLLVALVVAWLVALPGTLTIDIGDWRMQPRLGLVGLALVALIVGAVVVWAILRRLIWLPRTIARANAARRHTLGVDALSDGFIALQAGDWGRARQLAQKAEAALPDNAAASLLAARAALEDGDTGAARTRYRALIENPRTALAALSGLYEQARGQQRPAAALVFARKAAALAPVPWADKALLDSLTAAGDWTGALAQIDTRAPSGKAEKSTRKRQRTVLLTARARDAEATDPVTALTDAEAALKLAPDFVPAALIAGRIYAHRGETRKARSLIRRAYRLTAHPDLATLYAHAHPGASAVERLKRTHELVDGTPDARTAALAVARAAIEAYDWIEARNALAPYAGAAPSETVCLMMAEIEQGQSGNEGKAREWLSRAVRAPRDPQWTADGIVADEWAPVSPVNGALDAFEYRVPLTRSPAPVRDRPAPEADKPAPPKALPATGAPE